MLSPPPAAATSTRASKAGIVRTIEPCCSSAIHHAWRLHSRLHLGRKCRLEKVALVVRRSEAAGWRWSSSTLNECKPRFLGVAVMHWARTMATELRDSRSGRRQGSSSDWRVPYGRPHTLARAKRSNPSALIRCVLAFRGQFQVSGDTRGHREGHTSNTCLTPLRPRCWTVLTPPPANLTAGPIPGIPV